METRIERLKKNDIGYYALDGDDRGLLGCLRRNNNVIVRVEGGWVTPVLSFNDSSIYRISPDYQPEPANPVFPGYELCEVMPSTETTRARLTHNSDLINLSEAIDSGCVGYVFKELPDQIFNSPIVYVSESGGFRSACLTGYAPATLKYVVFRSKTDE